jgi:radical SAM protein (TIGR01212 family)
MKNEKPYYDLVDFFRNHFPFKVQKVPLNAGFSCPNRDGTKGVGGCSYCNNRMFSPGSCHQQKTIGEQLGEGVAVFSAKYPSMRYLAYFQTYTNTYGDTEKLMDMYREALAYPGVEGLIISTRPDCVEDDLLDALAELARNRFVMIEFGVESTLDRSLQAINRGHTFATSQDAIRRTAARGIYAGAHLILGLPGESREELLTHADKLSALPLSTVKLHHLQIIKNTRMAEQYAEQPDRFRFFTVDEYAQLCIEFAERLRPDIVIERFVSQSPFKYLIAPDCGIKNNEFTVKIVRLFNELGTRQGRLYE